MAADDLLIGELRGRVAMLERQNEQMLEAMNDMRRELAEINRTLSTATGGWKTLLAVGGAGATLGGLLMGLIGLMRGG